MFTKLPIYHLTDNIVERLKVSSTEQLFDNLMYVSNPQNANLCDLPFGGDQGLIPRLQIYHINDDVVEMLNNDYIIDVYTKLI